MSNFPCTAWLGWGLQGADPFDMLMSLAGCVTSWHGIVLQVRSLEVEKAELASDVTMQQDSQNAKAAEVERLRREVASAHAERHAAVQQVPFGVLASHDGVSEGKTLG